MRSPQNNNGVQQKMDCTDVKKQGKQEKRPNSSGVEDLQQRIIQNQKNKRGVDQARSSTEKRCG